MYNEMYHNLKALYLKYTDLDISTLTLTEFYRLIEKEKKRDENGVCTVFNTDYQRNRT